MHNLAPIIEKVSRDAIKRELADRHRFVRPSNNSNNEIYIFNGNDAPALMQEVGRLREITFRTAGGGTGKDSDIDEYDLGTACYQQLIVWDPRDEEIIGGYRFILCKDALQPNGEYRLSTTEIFNFSERLKTVYFPHTIELGRSWVQPDYQPSSENRKGLFSLDNLWDGLGALVILYPEIKYFFGKITMYTDFDKIARDHILSFMEYYFPDNENLVTVDKPIKIETDCSEFLQEIEGKTYKEGHAVLNNLVRSRGENIPPLFNSYMNISPSMKKFGTTINHHFGGVEETGIMLTIADIYESKKDRHVKTFLNYLQTKAHS